MSTMKTGSELSEIRNIANLYAHYAFTTQGKSTTTNKGENRASPLTSSAIKPEASASARNREKASSIKDDKIRKQVILVDHDPSLVLC